MPQVGNTFQKQQMIFRQESLGGCKAGGGHLGSGCQPFALQLCTRWCWGGEISGSQHLCSPRMNSQIFSERFLCFNGGGGGVLYRWQQFNGNWVQVLVDNVCLAADKMEK